MACPRVLAHGFVPTAACLRFVSGSGAWQYVALPAATVECCQPSPASWTGALEVLPNHTDSQCRQACSVHPACRFYSMRRRVCTMCRACDYSDRAAGRRRRRVRVRSFAKSRTPHLRAQRLVTSAVLSDVQHGYSAAVYGGGGRVDVRSLRILWLRHLSSATLHALARLGLCFKTARPPLNPFYWCVCAASASSTSDPPFPPPPPPPPPTPSASGFTATPTSTRWTRRGSGPSCLTARRATIRGWR